MCGIDRDGDVVPDLGAVGVVAVGDVGIGLPEAAFRERLLDEERHIGQRTEGGRGRQAGGGAEEVSAGEDLGRVHGAGVGAIFSAGPHCS
ncbi:MAG: hypothetical protein EB034_05735 [Verrucomicrobia bacterium]|nr:hypothetical protein [Verrucomicrobiota bacterium]